MDHDPWSFLRERLGNEVCEQIQERNKKDTETETVEYINNVTVACNYVCIMLFLDVLEEVVILFVTCCFVRLLQHSLSLDHDTLTAAAPVLWHCRGPDLL